jgi:hypothetical protein
MKCVGLVFTVPDYPVCKEFSFGEEAFSIVNMFLYLINLASDEDYKLK